MPKAKIAKGGDLYSISIKGLTRGEILSLKNALGVYGQVSPVAFDVSGYVNKAVDEFNETRTPHERIE